MRSNPARPARVLPLVVLLLLGGHASAAEQTVLGRKLAISDPGQSTRRKVSCSAREASSPNTLVGDPLTAGAVLEVRANGATSTAQTFVLPQGTSSSGRPFWSAVKSYGWQYKDRNGDNGAIRRVVQP